MRRLLAVALVAALVACGSGKQRMTSGSPTATTTTTTATTAPSTTAVVPTAREQLSAFVDAARETDARLRAAAAAINGAGPPWSAVTDEVSAAVTSAQPTSLLTTLPAGLPRDVVQQSVLVYSDLVSRWYAMGDFRWARDIPAEERAETSAYVLPRLGNGHAAAVRFADDLRQLEALAAVTPAITVASPSSQVAAEVALYQRFVELVNGGCDGAGGQIVTTLPMLEWQSSPGPDGYDFDGTIGGIPFIADPTDGTWTVTIWAC